MEFTNRFLDQNWPLPYHYLKDIDNRYVSYRFLERKKMSWMYKPVLLFLRDEKKLFYHFPQMYAKWGGLKQ